MKTPPKRPKSRDRESLEQSGSGEDDRHLPSRGPPPAPRTIRTAPSERFYIADAEEDVFKSADTPSPTFSQCTSGESPSVTVLRRQLERTCFDTSYMDRPISRPLGPREPPETPLRTRRRKRHSEPVDVGNILFQDTAQMNSGRPRGIFSRPSTRLVGPRQLEAACRDTGLVPQTPTPPVGSSAEDVAMEGALDDAGSCDDSDTGSPTPRPLRLASRPTPPLHSTGVASPP